MDPYELSRTLIRIEGTNQHVITVVVPGWNARETVAIPTENVPPNIRQMMHKGKRLHAKVNVGAEEKKNLMFKEWEPD